MTQIFAYITHRNGIAGDTAQELASAARKIDKNSKITAIVSGNNDEVDSVCNEISSRYKEIWTFKNTILSYPNAEIIRRVLIDVLPSDAIFLIPHCTFGMDLAPGLSIKINSTFVADVVDIEEVNTTTDTMRIVRQEFGGMVSTHVNCSINNGIILALRPGSFQSDEVIKYDGSIFDKSNDINDIKVGRKFIEVLQAEIGDVDITKSDTLISIGRGIEDEDNIEIAEELADALGAVVSCSRPIVDAKWMDKSRQVGTSGQTVKPKIYIACGISGSFQHIGGLKGSPFIIAINKNIKAPIFQIADIGIEADILDFLPELTEAINNI